MKPLIAITMGDPSGIGPEIIIKTLANPKITQLARFVVIGDSRIISRAAKMSNTKLPIGVEVIEPEDAPEIELKSLRPGKPSNISALAIPLYIEKAVDMASRREVSAIVTAPINKDMLKKAGFPFPGHTEFIAHLTGAKNYAMMLGGAKLKVVLATIHVPLKDVPGLITRSQVLKIIKITDDSFKKYFGLETPRIAVAGLNPHAGEAGHMGKEDEKIIRPAVEQAKKLGIKAQGPLAPDTVFYRAVKGEFDCVVAMYHDQGLAPLKLLYFEDGVNITLGLPIIRTSVDHGTAYDIAWKNKANPKSMIAAIEMAVAMAGRQQTIKTQTGS
ncbi:MAG: 4-hydroxythreonine-4-phosphate dehydrogenase PdxA [Deltaproteobacteria bacterium]|nr:4-hydroxythreonine-4-phosphate dehydrogenase PdxA [Deltaproteobacteria bacterium]